MDAWFHRFERPYRVRHRRRYLGSAGRTFRPQAHARRCRRPVFRFGRRFVVPRERHPSLRRGFVRTARIVQLLPHNRRYRRGIGVGRMSDVHSRDFARTHTRHARLVQPVRHNLRHAGRLLRKLSHTHQSRRYVRGHTTGYGRHRVAPHVPLGGFPRGGLLPAHTARAGDAAFPCAAR